MSKTIVVIGAGFSGLSAATCLAAKGYNVTLIEKHDQPGGRARKFEAEGFTFDMGPSWPPYRFMGTLNDLAPGHDAGLDCVCGGIMEGKPFVFDQYIAIP